MENNIKKLLNVTFVLCICLFVATLGFAILNYFYPDDTGFQKSIETTLTGFQAIILLLTLAVYIKLTDISNKTLEFTKTQSIYNSYSDNYKLYVELSKQKFDKLYSTEIDDGIKKYFDELSFNSIDHNLTRIIVNYSRSKDPETYEWVFKRFLGKIQSFIDILHYEIIKIKEDEKLNEQQKKTLLMLYQNYLLSEYIRFSKKIIETEEERKKYPERGLEKILYGGDKPSLNLDTERFLTLYNEFKY